MATVVASGEAALGNATDTASAWALAALALACCCRRSGRASPTSRCPLAGTFGATFPQVQWVVLAYLLANTTLIVGVGRLGDAAGRRRLLVAGIALFTIASVACALAPSLGWLIAARALQGLGAAVLMALSMAFAGDVVPKERTGSAMGLLGTMSAVGTALGPSLGGVLIAGPGWRTIFLVNVPLGILALVVALRGLPADRARRVAPGRIDATGTFVLALTLAAYALAMTLGRGQVGATTAALLAAAVAGLGLFVWIEMRAASPLVPLAMFRSPTLAAAWARPRWSRR
jgi:MFS family permease